MLEPQISRLGEPPSALDHDTANRFGKLLIPIIKSEVGVIMITHDLGFAEKFSD
ncbi:hypothetical protein [Alkalibacterium sp. 20]|uniref:hypothetical protein n=1 Tax=Alkalibacterium sp. 20 TaxID=1798803 RepID=UPI000AF70F8F|nr:hypothetical protein [Alkalibacterium sp. 20]